MTGSGDVGPPRPPPDDGAGPTGPPPMGGLRGRVLFMDDERNLRRMAEALLQLIGLEVETVADGEAAVRRYGEAMTAGRPFDAVVVDLTVPGGMGGREAAKLLRQRDPAARLIVSSGYTSDPAVAQFRDHGFCARVSKPYRAADLAAVLRAVLAAGRADGVGD